MVQDVTLGAWLLTTRFLDFSAYSDLILRRRESAVSKDCK